MEPVSVAACGVRVSEIAMDPQNPEIVYASMEMRGIYKSTDGGNNWSSTGSMKDLWGGNLMIDPKNPQIIFAGSVDGGKTWRSIWQSTAIFRHTIHPNNEEILYAIVTDKGLHKSINGGESWTPIGDEKLGICKEFALDTKNPNTLYGYFERKITDSSGNTRNIYAKEYGITGEIMKSVNDGVTWTPLLPTMGITYMAVDPSNSSIVYALNMQYGVYCSLDGGKRWNTVNHGLPNRTQVSVFAFDPVTPGKIYVGTSRGLFTRTDRGDNWGPVGNGLHVNVSILAINPKNPEIIYAGASGNGIFKTADGGITWYHSNKGLPEVSCRRKF